MENNNRKESWDKEMSIAQIFGQMFTGSVVAGVLVGIPVVFIVGLSWLGEYLPEESKLADDFKLQSEALTDFSQKQKVRKTNEGKINKMDKRTNLISDQNCNCLLGPKRKFAGFLQKNQQNQYLFYYLALYKFIFFNI